MNLTARDAERIFKTHAVFPDSFEICRENGLPQPLLRGDFN